ncbi:hypothetical protein ACFWHT_06495 [Microbacterium sp. NPDC058342]|uniref:hypothetical protein n=1 Tax=Microbacterium sp. NPDC058342 TaxID=3346454 RepID=UPI00364ABF0A
MRSDADDDALSWGGDDALDGRSPGVRRPEKRRTGAQGAPEADAGAAPSASATPTAADEPQGTGTVSLLLFGILGGVYLLYTVGWVIGGVGMQAPVMFTLPAALYQGALWLAVLAPAVWFVAVLVMTRGAKTWIRFAWLFAGAALLVPWPFVVAGGGALL